MRQGIMLNEHDYSILHFLYYGGALVSDILSRFFNTGTGTQATHQRRMWRRLNKMIGAGLIRYVISPRAAETILLLDIKGAQVVCNLYNLEIENAWLHFGKDSDMYHNLTTAELARRVVFDSKSSVFSVCDLEFEHYLKRQQGRRVVGAKGLGYPDYRVWIEGQSNQPRIYDVERDCGTIGKHAFEKKVNGSHYPLLIVTETVTRANWLFNRATDMNTTRRIYITSYHNLPQNIFSPLLCWQPPRPAPMSLIIWQQ